ncbi:MAG: hypothetical protein HOQ11_06800 [Gemmatimonadaceae bacterium]|nr:hypothetical protein [Gemmatimonadaceae bacterium]NUQ94475.1 hypothetical protein [Gemmatimonadaceae bacterium]NUR32447.1 hypothetical protein [Gemmatimonadaceae bacterium]NUS97098.1 hypothetical protein [Gemmatimonadaceae bacterium]
MSDLNVAAVGLFMLAVFPGLVSTTIYRLIMPARALEWGNAVVQGLFYSTVNFVLGLPVLYWLVLGHDPLTHSVRYSVAVVLVFLIGPVVWPIALVAIFKSKRIAQRIQIPYPTAWDFLFDKRQPSFLLVHLNSGALLGGYWGSRSYAASFPNDGDIYLEAVYSIDQSGRFGPPMPDTMGVLLRKDQYSYIELFAVPPAEEQSDVKR